MPTPVPERSAGEQAERERRRAEAAQAWAEDEAFRKEAARRHAEREALRRPVAADDPDAAPDRWWREQVEADAAAAGFAVRLLARREAPVEDVDDALGFGRDRVEIEREKHGDSQRGQELFQQVLAKVEDIAKQRLKGRWRGLPGLARALRVRFAPGVLREEQPQRTWHGFPIPAPLSTGGAPGGAPGVARTLRRAWALFLAMPVRERMQLYETHKGAREEFSNALLERDLAWQRRVEPRFDSPFRPLTADEVARYRAAWERAAELWPWPGDARRPEEVEAVWQAHEDWQDDRALHRWRELPHPSTLEAALRPAPKPDPLSRPQKPDPDIPVPAPAPRLRGPSGPSM